VIAISDISRAVDVAEITKRKRKMEKILKDVFKGEENKMNKLTREINEAENLEKKSELAELLLLVVNNSLERLEKFKIHKDYDDYRKTLLVRKDAAESIIRMKRKNSAGAISAVFNSLKRLFH